MLVQVYCRGGCEEVFTVQVPGSTYPRDRELWREVTAECPNHEHRRTPWWKTEADETDRDD